MPPYAKARNSHARNCCCSLSTSSRVDLTFHLGGGSVVPGWWYVVFEQATGWGIIIHPQERKEHLDIRMIIKILSLIWQPVDKGTP